MRSLNSQVYDNLYKTAITNGLTIQQVEMPPSILSLLFSRVVIKDTATALVFFLLCCGLFCCYGVGCFVVLRWTVLLL